MSLARVFTKIFICIILISSNLIYRAPSCWPMGTWVRKPSGSSVKSATSIVVSPQNSSILYIGTTGYVYETTDGGMNWQSLFALPGSDKTAHFITIDPKNPSVLYIASGAGIFKTINSGKNWNSISSDIGDRIVYYILVDSDNPDILFAGTDKGLFISLNSGREWSIARNFPTGGAVASLAQNQVDTATLYASSELGLYKTANGGTDWAKVLSYNVAQNEDEGTVYNEEDPLSANRTSVVLNPHSPEIVYASMNNTIFKSSDGGDTWDRLPGSGLNARSINNLVISPINSNYIFAATESGVFRYSEEKKIWAQFESGRNTLNANQIVLNSTFEKLWVAAKDGIYESLGDIYEQASNDHHQNSENILKTFSNEPTYKEVQDKAIRYADVHPKKITKWRRQAQSKALLPKLTFGIDRDSSKNLHWDAGSSPDILVIGPEDENTGWDISCSWDLGDLIWNDDQTSIDVRSRLMVQLRDDVLDEVNHLYFERRRLQIELLKNPPKDEVLLIEKELRLEELTAGLDAMTGGWFSEEVGRRSKN